ncbi:MAG TPA: ABC transporter substrate-binding protein [Chitinophagaceae bacterium]
MKKYFLYAILFLLFLQPNRLLAQNNANAQKLKIALFAPLYLDSAFDNTFNYRYGKNFPKFINPGLEFYEGAQMALDSLRKMGFPLEVYVYDSRSNKKNIRQQLSSPELKDVGLIIAHTTAQEIRTFADAARQLQIPFINANLPNDGGVNENPFFVILNPTLKTQCEGIYKFVQKNFAKKQIIVFRKKGQMEDLIKKYFDDYSDNIPNARLNLKYIDLPINFSANNLKTLLDSNTHNIVVAGSLDENFGKTLAAQLAELNETYPVTVVGMPTWDNIRDFNKEEYKGLEIIYSTPFYNAKTDWLSMHLNNVFNTNYYARPSDMVYRGYEVVWRFAHLLAKYKKDIGSNFINNENNVFTDYEIQPVFLNHDNMTLDYFENKHLYFIKYMDGEVKAVY